MLRIARARSPRAFWVQADAARLPLRDETFDYITSQYSYQHVRRTRQLLQELFRVLKPAGRFVMTNIDPSSMTGWLVYRYFPDALALDFEDFLPVAEFVSAMEAAGFRDIRVARADLSRSESLRDFLGYASARHRASQLMAISDQAYAAGIRRLKDELAAAGREDLVSPSEFVVVTISGDRAGNTRRSR